jgi:hypothetical protein
MALEAGHPNQTDESLGQKAVWNQKNAEYNAIWQAAKQIPGYSPAWKNSEASAYGKLDHPGENMAMISAYDRRDKRLRHVREWLARKGAAVAAPVPAAAAAPAPPPPAPKPKPKPKPKPAAPAPAPTSSSSSSAAAAASAKRKEPDEKEEEIPRFVRIRKPDVVRREELERQEREQQEAQEARREARLKRNTRDMKARYREAERNIGQMSSKSNAEQIALLPLMTLAQRRAYEDSRNDMDEIAMRFGDLGINRADQEHVPFRYPAVPQEPPDEYPITLPFPLARSELSVQKVPRKGRQMYIDAADRDSMYRRPNPRRYPDDDPEDDAKDDYASRVGMGMHPIIQKLRALRQGSGQSTSRYKPSGYVPTKRDINTGKFVFENPHMFIIPNDEITRDAIRKIEADIGLRIGHPEVNTRIRSLYGRIPKLAERLAWLGRNVDFQPNAHAQRFKAEIEALQDRLMPVERIVEERIDPGIEPAIPGSYDFLDQEEEKYEEPGLYEDPGVQDAAAAAAEPPAPLQARFQDALRTYAQIREHIPIADRREAAILNAQIETMERGAVSPNLMRRFIEQVNQLLGPGVGSGRQGSGFVEDGIGRFAKKLFDTGTNLVKSSHGRNLLGAIGDAALKGITGGSAEPQQHALHTPPLRGGSAEPQQHALHTPPLAFRFGKKREYLEGGNY